MSENTIESLRATIDAQTAIIVDLKAEKAGLELDVERLRAQVEADRSLRRIAANIADMPASADPPPWDAICEAHIAPMRAEIERLRAFVPVWERVMGAWELRACGIRVGWVEWVGHDYIARIDVGRGGWRPAGTHPDLPTAAVAVCARLGIPSVEVPS